MFSKEGEAVSATGNFNLAVAMATFGFPHQLKRMRDEVSGNVFSTLWLFGLEPILYSKSHPEEPLPSIRANVILRMVRDGSLHAQDPSSPILDVLHALNIFERVRTFMERATPFRIAQTTRGRATLEPGSEPAADITRPAIRTDSLELAVALIRVGVPLLACEGIAPHRRIVLAATGYDLGDGPVDSKTFAASINDGTLQKTSPSHSSLWAVVGLSNRRAMKAELDHGHMPLLLRNPRSVSWERRRKSFIMHGKQDGKAIDNARKDL